MQTRSFTVALAAAVALTLASPGCASTAEAAATVAACANPALPPSILDGAAIARTPLRLITATTRAASLGLAVASDEDAREQGLMCVLHLKPQRGMLFVFEGSDRMQEFWMKNTLIALDMIWVRADGTIDTVAPNVPASTRETPDDAIARRSGRGKYVIELAGGEAAADGLRRGDRVTFVSTP